MFGFFGSSQEMQPPASLKHSKSGLGVPASYMEERSLTLMENHHTQCKTHPEHPVAPLYQVAKQSNLPEAILWHVTFYVKTKCLLSCFFSMLFFSFKVNSPKPHEPVFSLHKRVATMPSAIPRKSLLPQAKTHLHPWTQATRFGIPQRWLHDRIAPAQGWLSKPPSSKKAS